MTDALSRIPDELLISMERYEELRQQRKAAGLPALRRLTDAARGGGGQAVHIRRFLLGLYNADQWPFELNRFRALDAHLQQAALQVLALDWNGQEVHTYLRDGDLLFQSWWKRESEA